MEVQLYVYDLTRGMARAMSQQLLGIQIDAVYHTSLVFNNVEYFFGAGVQTCYPGATHHGQPMEVVNMGSTELPLDTILDYLQSLKEIYTPESYDLFAHNCNNFTNDFGMFLVGKGIPDHITSLPKRVLDTPFGQMLRPQIDASMRSITQAEVPPQARPPTATNQSSLAAGRGTSSVALQQANNSSGSKSGPFGKVLVVTNNASLDSHMAKACESCTTIFFTSSTCAPCRLAYPMFDNLAEEYPQALFVKIDINDAYDVSSKYSIRATPTFMTFSKGTKKDEWSGADPTVLKANVDRLVKTTFPPHPHLLLKVPTLQFGSMKPITYTRVPPLDKLMSKLGPAGHQASLTALRRFVDKRTGDPKEATLPDLQTISRDIRAIVPEIPVEGRFAAVDLLRCAMIDPRISGFFAEEAQANTISTIIKHINGLQDCPHNLRLVTIHLACNTFTSPLFIKELLGQHSALASEIVQLIASSLLDASHPTTRVAAASMAFNLATANYRMRREEAREGLAEEDQVELTASVTETLSLEDNSDAAKTLLLALGYLIYSAPQGGEVMDLCRALDAKSTISSCQFHAELVKEVTSLL